MTRKLEKLSLDELEEASGGALLSAALVARALNTGVSNPYATLLQPSVNLNTNPLQALLLGANLYNSNLYGLGTANVALQAFATAAAFANATSASVARALHVPQSYIDRRDDAFYEDGYQAGYNDAHNGHANAYPDLDEADLARDRDYAIG